MFGCFSELRKRRWSPRHALNPISSSSTFCLNPKYSMDPNGPTHWKSLRHFPCIAQSSGLRQSCTREGKLTQVLVTKNIKFRGKDCKANTSESICWLIYQHTEQWDHTSIFVFHYCHFLPLKYSCFWNTQKFLANPMINSQQKSLYFLSFPEDFIYFFLTAKHNKINPSCFTVLGIQFWPGMSRAICSILSRMVVFKNLTLTWEAVTGTASWL